MENNLIIYKSKLKTLRKNVKVFDKLKNQIKEEIKHYSPEDKWIVLLTSLQESRNLRWNR